MNDLEKAMALGSPPLTWRKVQIILCVQSSQRITSTYVEKRSDFLFSLLFFEDHLHLRGEKISLLLVTCLKEGSPPLTWRQEDSVSTIFTGLGITSTYVEKRIMNDLEKAMALGSPPLTWRKVL